MNRGGHMITAYVPTIGLVCLFAHPSAADQEGAQWEPRPIPLCELLAEIEEDAFRDMRLRAERREDVRRTPWFYRPPDVWALASRPANEAIGEGVALDRLKVAITKPRLSKIGERTAIVGKIRTCFARHVDPFDLMSEEEREEYEEAALRIQQLRMEAVAERTKAGTGTREEAEGHRNRAQACDRERKAYQRRQARLLKRCRNAIKSARHDLILFLRDPPRSAKAPKRVVFSMTQISYTQIGELPRLRIEGNFVKEW